MNIITCTGQVRAALEELALWRNTEWCQGCECRGIAATSGGELHKQKSQALMLFETRHVMTPCWGLPLAAGLSRHQAGARRAVVIVGPVELMLHLIPCVTNGERGKGAYRITLGTGDI
jgi:hypothetical protein